MKRIITLLAFAIFSISGVLANSPDTIISSKLYLVRHPITKRYGYAFKQQNISSPIHGTVSTSINILGSGASMLIDKKEAENIDWAVPPQYTKAATKFRENLSMVSVNGKVGFIDVYNRFIIEPKFDDSELDGFHNCVAAVKSQGKWGYINKRGEFIIQPKYEEADAFNDNLIAAVKLNDKWGAIDINGNIVLPCENKIKAAMITVPVSNKEWRRVNGESKDKKNTGGYTKKLNEILAAAQAVENKISNSAKESLKYTVVNGIDSLGVIDQHGRYIVPEGYHHIKYCSTDKVYIVESNNRYGAFLYNGSKLINPCFDSMTAFSGGRSTVTVADTQGWIDINGNLSESFLSDIVTKGIEEEKTSKLRARELYERSLQINPEYSPAINNIALLDIANKDYNKGIRALKTAHEIDPNNETVTKNLQWAKDNRKERRAERWSTGLDIAMAVIGMATTTYSTYSSIKNGGSADAGSYSTSSGSLGSYGSSSSGGSSVGPGKCKECAGNGVCSGNSAATIKSHCHGSGKCTYCSNGIVYTNGNQIKCSACNGKGKCKYCDGTGKCHRCHGTGKA